MIEVQLDGCIYELNFGYNTKMEGYTNSNSDIPKLCEMPKTAIKFVSSRGRPTIAFNTKNFASFWI